MTELVTTQPYGIASILAALALVLSVVANGLRPILAQVALAIAAWTRRTNDERDCAPKLAAALAQIETLRAEFERFRNDVLAGGGSLEHVPRVLEQRDDEPTGDQRLPHGMPPLPKKKDRTR